MQQRPSFECEKENEFESENGVRVEQQQRGDCSGVKPRQQI